MWWKKFLTYILNLLKEPTTCLSVFNFLACLGVTIQPEPKTIIQSLYSSEDDTLIVFLKIPHFRNRPNDNLYINIKNNIELSIDRRQSKHLKDNIQSIKTIQQLAKMQKELDSFF